MIEPRDLFIFEKIRHSCHMDWLTLHKNSSKLVI